MFESLTSWLFYLLQNFGLVGLFVATCISSSLIPIPVEIFLATMISLGFSPFLVALTAAIGSTLGGATTYYLGRGASKIAKLDIERTRNFIEKYGSIAVFIFAFTPLPYDAVALASGVAKLSREKFLFATFTGRLARFLMISEAIQISVLLLGQAWQLCMRDKHPK